MRVMRQNDNLLGMFYQLPNQLLSTSAPELILAREGIVQHNDFAADIGILVYCGKKKGQCECTSVSRTQCCFETWRSGLRAGIAKINSAIVDLNLV